VGRGLRCGESQNKHDCCLFSESQASSPQGSNGEDNKGNISRYSYGGVRVTHGYGGERRDTLATDAFEAEFDYVFEETALEDTEEEIHSSRGSRNGNGNVYDAFVPLFHKRAQEEYAQGDLEHHHGESIEMKRNQ
jgi:hypothetical protein